MKKWRQMVKILKVILMMLATTATIEAKPRWNTPTTHAVAVGAICPYCGKIHVPVQQTKSVPVQQTKSVPVQQTKSVPVQQTKSVPVQQTKPVPKLEEPKKILFTELPKLEPKIEVPVFKEEEFLKKPSSVKNNDKKLLPNYER